MQLTEGYFVLRVYLDVKQLLWLLILLKQSGFSFKIFDLQPNVLFVVVTVALEVHDFHGSIFSGNYLGTELIQNIDIFYITQRSLAKINQIQQKAHWEVFWQIIQRNLNSSIF